VPQSSEDPVQEMAATERRQDGLTANADVFKTPAKAEVTPDGHHSSFERLDGVEWASSLDIDFCEIQIWLSVIAFRCHRDFAECLSLGKPVFSKSGEKASVGHVKRVLRSDFQRAADA